MNKIRFKLLNCGKRVLIQDDDGQSCTVEVEESESLITYLFKNEKRSVLKSSIMHYSEKFAKSA